MSPPLPVETTTVLLVLSDVDCEDTGDTVVGGGLLEMEELVDVGRVTVDVGRVTVGVGGVTVGSPAPLPGPLFLGSLEV